MSKILAVRVDVVHDSLGVLPQAVGVHRQLEYLRGLLKELLELVAPLHQMVVFARALSQHYMKHVPRDDGWLPRDGMRVYQRVV